ncbi:MAG TPA: alpha/beta hydrolase, partial [Verrucomicrobiaceae bacterium]
MKRLILSLVLLTTVLTARAELKTDLEFAKPNGFSLTLDAFVPDGAGPFPACILVHGGGFTKGDKTTFIKPLFEPLSKAGYAWFTINYRLAPDHRWPACLDDVESAIRWVRAHASEFKVDTKRIALIGESAGGHLVSLAGVRSHGENALAAVVPFYAPHDLVFQCENRNSVGPGLAGLFGISEDMNDAARKLLREASPSQFVKPGLPPFLLIHGDKDDKVPYEQSPRFQKKMREAGNTCDLITIPGGGHGMGGWSKL